MGGTHTGFEKQDVYGNLGAFSFKSAYFCDGEDAASIITSVFSWDLLFTQEGRSIYPKSEAPSLNFDF